MNRYKFAFIVTAVLAASLAVDLHTRNRQLDALMKSSNKLDEWANVAQRVMKETWKLHPEIIEELSEETKNHINFYNLMSKENLI